jgi:hypothetical protein
MNPNSSAAGSRPEVEPQRPAHTQLFTLRVWQAELGQGQSEWRGQLQQVVGGQIRYFRDWPTLILYLGELLSQADSPGSDANGAEPG